MKFHRSRRALIVCLALLTPVFVGAPMAIGAEAMTPAQKEAIENVVRDYLRLNPEILVDAIQGLRAKQEAAQRGHTRAALISERETLINDPTSPVAGNPKGDVTVVEFFDYNCPYCKKVLPAITALLKADGNIRYVFKEYPILGPESLIATRAALAAWVIDPKTYLTFHSAMMSAKGLLTEGRIMRFAEKSGLDIDTLRKTMNGLEVETALRANFALADKLGISGTPAFIIGEHLVPGALDIAALKKLIAAARKG